MKKILLTLFVSGLLFSSCQKCVECTNCPNDVALIDTEICEDNFASKDDYNTAIEQVESLGCNCK